MTKEIEQIIQDSLPNITSLIINSDNANTDEIKNIIEKVNQEINKYQVVIVSPSLDCDISIDEPHFDFVVGLFHGESISAANASQMLVRVRNMKIPRYIWVNKRRNINKIQPFDPNQILNDFIKNQTENIELLNYYRDHHTGEYKFDPNELNKPECQLWLDCIVDKNISKSFFKDELIVQLQYEGHLPSNESINFFNIDIPCDVNINIKESKNKIRQKEAERIVNAKKINENEAWQIKSNKAQYCGQVSQKDKDSLEKYYLEKFYNQTLTPELVEMEQKEKLSKKLQNLIKFLMPIEYTVEKDQNSQNNFVTDRTYCTLKIKLLKDLGINQFINPSIIWRQDSENIEFFKKNLVDYYENIKRILEIDVNPHEPVKALGTLLNNLGLKTQSSKTRVAGKQVRQYSLNPERYTLAIRVVEACRKEWENEKITNNNLFYQNNKSDIVIPF